MFGQIIDVPAGDGEFLQNAENVVETTNTADNLDNIVDESNKCLLQLVKESKLIAFDNPVTYIEPVEVIAASNEVSSQNIVDGADDDDQDEYIFDGTARQFKELTIKLGNNEIPRFSCANHKCNIAVRRAIKQHNDLTAILKKLSSYAGTEYKF